MTMHRLSVGERLMISAPKNHFRLATTSAKRIDILNVLSQQVISTKLYLCGPIDFIQQLDWQTQTLG